MLSGVNAATDWRRDGILYTPDHEMEAITAVSRHGAPRSRNLRKVSCDQQQVASGPRAVWLSCDGRTEAVSGPRRRGLRLCQSHDTVRSCSPQHEGTGTGR